MLTVTTGEVSPIPSGIVYCGAIGGCRDGIRPAPCAGVDRALHEWCERQPDMLAFTGDCYVHRAEIMQLHGAWADALERARSRRAASRRVRATPASPPRPPTGAARSCACAVSSPRAERAYREAARGGCEPQPGLALLRLATGRRRLRRSPRSAACSSETTEPPRRAVLLPACVEIMLGAGDVDAARAKRARSSRRSRPSGPSDMLAARGRARARRGRARRW